VRGFHGFQGFEEAPTSFVIAGPVDHSNLNRNFWNSRNPWNPS
jgi:hypothetical protein